MRHSRRRSERKSQAKGFCFTADEDSLLSLFVVKKYSRHGKLGRREATHKMHHVPLEFQRQGSECWVWEMWVDGAWWWCLIWLLRTLHDAHEWLLTLTFDDGKRVSLHATWNLSKLIQHLMLTTPFLTARFGESPKRARKVFRLKSTTKPHERTF